jgi:Uma2 family endonuclease
VDGELVLIGPAACLPGRASGRIYASLLHQEEEEEVGGGYACPDNIGLLVQVPNRQSFSPDAAWHLGEADTMKFAQGAPVLAVEVRSEENYGRRAEAAITRTIADYLAAGSLVVWDVDLLGEGVIRKYSADAPDHPVVFRRGDIADAEPAVPGWRFPVDRVFPRS